MDFEPTTTINQIFPDCATMSSLLSFFKLTYIFYVYLSAGITYLSGENFLDELDNGAELCQLAAVIHERAREALDQGLIVGVSNKLWLTCFFSFMLYPTYVRVGRRNSSRTMYVERRNSTSCYVLLPELGNINDNSLQMHT